MAQPNPPPPAPQHHHHPHAPGTATHAGPHDPLVNPEDLKNPYVADHLRRSLPEHMIDAGGHPKAAPGASPAPDPVLSPEQMLDQTFAHAKEAYLKNFDDVPDAVRRIIELAFLLYGIDIEAVREGLPFNSPQVLAGGHATLNACTNVGEAASMKVDAPVLGQDLAQAERIRRLLAIINPAHQVLEANERQVLNRVADQVDGALKRGASVIQSNGALFRAMGPALAIREEPVAAGQTTKGHNQGLEAKVRADEQAKAAAADEPAKAQTTTTVTTQSAPANQASSAQKVPVPHRTHSTNKTKP